MAVCKQPFHQSTLASRRVMHPVELQLGASNIYHTDRRGSSAVLTRSHLHAGLQPTCRWDEYQYCIGGSSTVADCIQHSFTLAPCNSPVFFYFRFFLPSRGASASQVPNSCRSCFRFFFRDGSGPTTTSFY